MNRLWHGGLKVARRITARLWPQVGPRYLGPQVSGDEAGDLIRRAILGADPAMICRLGSQELDCVAAYQNQLLHPGDIGAYLRGEIDHLDWNLRRLKEMAYMSGFFPCRMDMIERFARHVMEEMSQADILGTWRQAERFFNRELAQAVKVPLRDLNPYLHQRPWSEALKDMTVLVVHPFAESIRRQYQKRELLFADKRVLPEFELKTLKAVQTIAGNEAGFASWFEALNHMTDEIAAMEFDVAILGCGAYGFSLAAQVKRMGKKALHLGGGTQILFGIKGRRWEAMPEIHSLMNEHWARPLDSERPTGSEGVESGAYW